MEYLKRIDQKVDAGFTGLRADVSVLHNNYVDLTQRMTIGERWRQEYDEWRARTSERAKAEEETRAKGDTALAKQFADMTAQQTGTLVAAMERAAKTPQGQKLINALVGFLVIVLTAGGGWLLMHGGAK